MPAISFERPTLTNTTVSPFQEKQSMLRLVTAISEMAGKLFEQFRNNSEREIHNLNAKILDDNKTHANLSKQQGTTHVGSSVFSTLIMLATAGTNNTVDRMFISHVAKDGVSAISGMVNSTSTGDQKKLDATIGLSTMKRDDQRNFLRDFKDLLDTISNLFQSFKEAVLGAARQ